MRRRPELGFDDPAGLFGDRLAERHFALHADELPPAYREELSSGRARQRVARDVELALRLGLNGTPVFFYEGASLTSDKGAAEAYIESRLRNPSAATGGASSR